MSKPPSLRDVADAAGLSPATVSRYLNGSLSLPAGTVERIETTIAKLKYQPNPYARSLSRGRSDTIGLVVPEIDNPFFAKLAAAVERAAEAAGQTLVLFASLNRPERELFYLDKLNRNFFDGMLLATNHTDNGALAQIINQSKSIVIIDEDIKEAIAPRVFSENYTGGNLAAQHFLANGHRRLAFISGPEDILTTQERGGGFCEGLESSNVGATVKAKYHGTHSVDWGREATLRLLETHHDVTGIFVSSDEILYGVLDILRAKGIQVGRDMSVITFDDAGPLAFLDPAITAIRQPVEDIGKTAFDILMRRIAGKKACETIRLPVELVIRRSVHTIA